MSSTDKNKINIKKIAIILVVFLLLLVAIFAIVKNMNKDDEVTTDIATIRGRESLEAKISYETLEDNLNNTVTINLIAKSESGIKQVELPNGTVQYFNGEKEVTIQYTVDKNSDYTFKVIDLDGNIAEKTINISKIKEETSDDEEKTDNSEKDSREASTKGNKSISKNSTASNKASNKKVETKTSNTKKETKSENTKQEGQSESSNQDENKETETENQNEESNDSTDVTDVDTIAPNEYNPEITATTYSITVSGATVDNKTLASNLKYYYSIDSGVTYTDAEQTTYTFDNLAQNKEYQIAIKVVDEAGNERIVKIKNSTLQVPEYNTNNVEYASNIVTANDISPEYTLLYAIGENGEFNTYTGPIEIEDYGNVIVKFKYSDIKEQKGQETKFEQFVVPNANGNITINLNTEELADKVTVNLVDLIQKEELIIEYKVGEDGQWQEYSTPFDIEKDTTIYARYTEKNNTNNIGKMVSRKIDNINYLGTIYARKDPTWSNLRVYLRDDNGKVIEKAWPGYELTEVEDDIYSIAIKKSMFVEGTDFENLSFELQFNNRNSDGSATNNNKYKAITKFKGFDKVYYITRNATSDTATGIWVEYEEPKAQVLLGKVYFEKPNEWATPYAYLTGDIQNSWPGVELIQEEGNTYYFEITEEMIPNGVEDVASLNLSIQFNNGGSNTNTNSSYKYKLTPVSFEGCEKIYVVTSGSTTTSGTSSSGIWMQYKKEENNVLGKIYFNKPVSWEHPHAYLYNSSNSSDELLGAWPGVELTQEEDYIYYFEITKDMVDSEDDIKNYKITFNNGGSTYNQSNSNYKYNLTDADCVGFNKIYNVTSKLATTNKGSTGEWLDYSSNIKIGKIPTTTSNVKNVIYMIGDGMGENHIKAGELYKGETLNIQTINNKTYATTLSTESVTDSAAGATALASGYKTTNGTIGKDKNGNDVQNIIEYANSNGQKTGMVVTQILNHATPAGFSVHNTYRYNYSDIAKSQINSCVDLMLGGGRQYFSSYTSLMQANGFTYINSLSDINGIDKNERVIGTFAEGTISEVTEDRTSLAEMTETALSRLENDNGFFLMIEGSDIDTYSHQLKMSNMLNEMIDFDDAIGVAMKYVDEHPDTLLVITADHETGGLTLDGVTSKEQLVDSLFTNQVVKNGQTEGAHTETNVPVYAYGKGASDLTNYKLIDNTSIFKFVKQVLTK